MFLSKLSYWFDPVSWRGAFVYCVAVGLSAGLVFVVQPIFAKMAMPLLGGSAGVWNVSLVCFQAALLLGYVYAHMLGRFLSALSAQITLHAGLIVVAGLTLPFQLSYVPSPSDLEQPAFWLIGLFGLSIALPFAVISATAPLIQSWYSRSGRADAADPYYLYAASNIGSLAGLALYPVVIEPLMTLTAQTQVWTAGYWVLAVLLVLSGVSAFLSGRGMSGTANVKVMPDMPGFVDQTHTPQATWRQRLRWIVLAFIPSSLLIGATTYVSTDVASAPLLWVVPLMLYIGTFTIVFAKRPLIGPDIPLRFLPVAVAAVMLDLPPVSGPPLLLSFFLNLAALFLAAMVCHGLLARERPPASRLTEFYLLMSLGGVLGGAFNALLAPVLFDTIIEYPIFLILVLVMIPQWDARPGSVQHMVQLGGGFLSFIAMLAVVVMSVFWGREMLEDQIPYKIGLAMAVLAILMVRGRRFLLVMAAICAWLIGILASPFAGGYTERGFFGVAKILDEGDHRLLIHGVTLHGAQYITGKDRLLPTTYYAPETPIGQAFSMHDRPGRVGIVGLGTGSVACYARPGQQYTFYEIDPLVARLASNPERFTYLSQCAPDADIILGDARLTLAEEPEAAFDLLLIDAFSSDSVPTHLITREAVSLYLSRLAEDGILVMHISNKYMKLDNIVARIADDLGIHARYKFYQRARNDKDNFFRAQASYVALLARSEKAFERFPSSDGWVKKESDGHRPWTDNYSNVAGAIWEKIGPGN